MSQQIEKPGAPTPSLSETYADDNAAMDSLQCQEHLDTTTAKRTSISQTPRKSSRTAIALAGQWGEVVEFEASVSPAEAFQSMADSTLDALLEAGGHIYGLLYLLLERYRYEPSKADKALLEEYYDADYSEVTWAYLPKTLPEIAADYRRPVTTTRTHLHALRDLGFVEIIEQGKLERPRVRRQDGNVYVLRGVRLPGDRFTSKASRLTAQAVSSTANVTVEGSVEVENTRTTNPEPIPSSSKTEPTTPTTATVRHSTPLPNLGGPPSHIWEALRPDLGVSSLSLKTSKDLLQAPRPKVASQSESASIKDEQLRPLNKYLSEEQWQIALLAIGVSSKSEITKATASDLISWSMGEESPLAEAMEWATNELLIQRLSAEGLEEWGRYLIAYSKGSSVVEREKRLFYEHLKSETRPRIEAILRDPSPEGRAIARQIKALPSDQSLTAYERRAALAELITEYEMQRQSVATTAQ